MDEKQQPLATAGLPENAGCSHEIWLRQLLEREPESFAPAARRLLARLASERAMPLRQLVDVAAIMANLESAPAMGAGKKLITLVETAPH